MVLFLYCGEINFAPLYRDGQTIDPLTPSARSVYRLADQVGLACLAYDHQRLVGSRRVDQYGLKDLQAKAKEFIVSNLTVANVATELFRNFTSWSVQFLTCNFSNLWRLSFSYPEICEAELQFAMQNITFVKKTHGWQEEMRSVSRGEKPHAEDLFMKLVSL
jgi:hypothetical protein